MNQAPLTLTNGGKGLLADGKLKEYVDKYIPDLSKEIEKETDPHLVTCLFRDYTFLISMYALEPSHLHLLKTGNYGLARDSIPYNLGRPAVILSKKLKYNHPWLD